jgi:hypothetical protein
MHLSFCFALVICIALVFAIILLSPLTLSLSGSFRESARHFTSYLSWFHPVVCRCVIDGKKRSFSIIVFGRFRLFSSHEDEEPGPVPVSGKRGGDNLRPEEKAAVEKSDKIDEKEKTFGHASNKGGFDAGKYEDTKTAGLGNADAKENKEHGTAFAKEKKKMFGFMDSQPVQRTMVVIRAAALRRKLFHWFVASVARFFHIVSVSRFRLHVRLGLNDPSTTGQAFGFYIAAKNALAAAGNSRKARKARKEIMFEPVFDSEIAEADGTIEISTSLARLCLPVVLTIATFPFLHTLMVYWKVKRVKAET